MSKINFALLVGAVCFTSLLQADMEESKELFNEAKCMECHNNEDFQSRKEKVDTFAQLHKSVQACSSSNSTGWFEEDEDGVTRFLNKKFYHFKAPAPTQEDE